MAREVKRNLTRLLACMALAGSAIVMAAPANAADDAQFLRSIEGDWRGRGSVQIPGREQADQVSCRISNEYDENAKALVLGGECATTQGKTAVKGKLSHDGPKVTGALINALAGGTMTSSTGTLSPESLTVSANFVNDATGNLTRSRQIIRKTAGGFEAQFFTYDNKQKTYLKAGELVFSGD